MNFKCGKQAPKYDKRTLHMENYLAPKVQLPPTPPSADIGKGITDWPMFANDRFGCCVLSYAANHLMVRTSDAGHITVLSDTDVLEAYHEITGFDPVTGANDNGTNMLDAYKYLRTVGIGGKKIDAFAALNPRNLDYVKFCIAYFEGIGIGVRLPNNYIDSLGSDGPWTLSGNPNPSLGHCVLAEDYDEESIWVRTWRLHKQLTWDQYLQYVDEAWVAFASDMLDDSGKSPAGFDSQSLLNDLTAIHS